MYLVAGRGVPSHPLPFLFLLKGGSHTRDPLYIRISRRKRLRKYGRRNNIPDAGTFGILCQLFNTIHARSSRSSRILWFFSFSLFFFRAIRWIYWKEDQWQLEKNRFSESFRRVFFFDERRLKIFRFVFQHGDSVKKRYLIGLA